MKIFRRVLFSAIFRPSFASPIEAPPHHLTVDRQSSLVKAHTPPPLNAQQHSRRALTAASSGGLRNLVIPIRFSDHADRQLPSIADLDVVFNSLGGDEYRDILAPTGSVRDVFLYNSYNSFEVISSVLNWVNVSQTEGTAAGGAYGMSAVLLDSLYEALAIADVSGIDLNEFDQDQDGMFDAITFLHSGFMAEWGGQDCYGTKESDRIWSHKWSIPPEMLRMEQERTDLLSINMDSYVIASAVWGKCGSEIARIGLLAHETAHNLGLDDLYDASRERKGRGLGSYDLMSDTWGLDYSQHYPPMMSPWTKSQLGWLEPTVITTNGKYSLAASATVPDAFRINAGFDEGEYLLIENRQAVGFDALISKGGLAIYHIDEHANGQKRRGHPYQPDFPKNHYMVALLQADGKYDLERGRNSGDEGDLWHANCGRTELGPGRNNTHPNTDAYTDGIFKSTGIVISDISESGEVMSFRIQSPHLQEPYSRGKAVVRDSAHNEDYESLHDIISETSILLGQNASQNASNTILSSKNILPDHTTSSVASGGSLSSRARRVHAASAMTTLMSFAFILYLSYQHYM